MIRLLRTYEPVQYVRTYSTHVQYRSRRSAKTITRTANLTTRTAGTVLRNYRMFESELSLALRLQEMHCATCDYLLFHFIFNYYQ